MPNLRTKTWTTTTPAYVEDAQYWEDHLISDEAAAKAASSVQTVNNTSPDASGNVDIVALPPGGTTGQVLTKVSNTSGDANWVDPASSGHTIEDADGVVMTQQTTLQFLNAEVSNDSANSKTVVDCQGEKGDPGDAATVTVGTVTTLPAGSSATVTNSGTTSAAIFDFGIPKGADGSGAVSSVNNKTGAVVLDLGDMDDVTISTPSDNDAIVYDSGDWVNIPLPLVALTGSYGDLQNKPTIPAAQVNSDWDSSSGVSEILNKPTIPTISVSHDGTATTTTVRKQKITINGTAYDVDGSMYMEGTANSASFAFTNAAILTTSVIEPYTDTWGDVPSNVEVPSAGTCNVTFSAAKTRTVRIYIK